jgi:hypothetical protein
MIKTIAAVVADKTAQQSEGGPTFVPQMARRLFVCVCARTRV